MKDWQGVKVLLTGATGFVGAHLAKRLVAEGSEVHVIVREGSDMSPLGGIKDSICVHVHDGTLEGMFSVIENSEPYMVFHLASLFISEHQPSDVQPLIESNLHFGVQLLEAMRKFRVECFVNTGTSWQHYEGPGYNPVNLYAATKQAYEDILAYYVETSGVRAITLKLFDTYGPNDTRGKIVQLLMRIAFTGEQLIMSPGEQLLDLVHVEDVVEAFVIAAKRIQDGVGQRQQSYGISSGQPVQLKELAKTIGEVVGKKLDIEWGGRPYRGREVMRPWAASESLPGWSPAIPLTPGLKGVLESRAGENDKG